jgi:hypothetical protein
MGLLKHFLGSWIFKDDLKGYIEPIYEVTYGFLRLRDM